MNHSFTPGSIAHSERIIGHARKTLYTKENGWNAKMPTTQVQKIIRSGRLLLSTFSWLLRHPQPIVVSCIVAAIAFFGYYFLHDQLCTWLDALNQYANRMFEYLETINVALRSMETVG